MDITIIAILALSGVLSIVCWVALWRGGDHLLSKIVWTVLAAAPVVGPLLFKALHDRPPVQPEADQASGSGWDVPGHYYPPDSHP